MEGSVTSEKNFQSYFFRTVPHGYRTALTTGGGFPDGILIHGDRHSMVELKIIEIGPSGNKKIKGLFKKTQPPWYWQYLAKGGTRLYVVFRIGGLKDAYGVLRVTNDFLRSIDTIDYKGLCQMPEYTEHDNLTDLLKEHFS